LLNILKKYRYPLAIIAIILAAYSPFFLNGGFIGDFGDPIGQTITNKFLLAHYLQNGIAPLWNPYSFMGMPFLADIQVGTFYFPDIAIFSIFSPVEAHNISLILHLLFAALGFFLFFKKIGISEKAAATSSIILITTGSFLSKLFFLNMIATFAYLPWIALISLGEKNTIPKLALITCLMVFAGHPVAAMYVLLSVGIFHLIYSFKQWVKLLRIITGLFLGLLLSAIQLVPFWNLKNLSVRDSLSFEDFASGSIHLKNLLDFINPFKEQTGIGMGIHFGTIAFAILIISILFFKKFNKNFKKLYIIGLVLSIVGLILSTLGGVEFIRHIFYNVPIINITRVAARFIYIFHFGSALCLGIFLTYLFQNYSKLASFLSVIIILNSIFVTNIFLERHEISDAYKQYQFENQNLIKATPEPQYFLNSSNFLFPNRHYLSLTTNLIGYNPLMLKTYHNKIPVDAYGGFSSPSYFPNNYENFIKFGLKYYIFPSNSTKVSTTDFLKEKNWTPITKEGKDFTIWENPNTAAFAKFENTQNKVTVEKFSPGEIILKTEMASPDKLILNQSYYPGWEAEFPNSETVQAEIYDDLIQSYKIPKTSEIKIIFNPKDFNYGKLISLISLIITMIFLIPPRAFNYLFNRFFRFPKK
jgi:hypothetical protein